MDNERIAKELVRLAKELSASDSWTNDKTVDSSLKSMIAKLGKIEKTSKQVKTILIQFRRQGSGNANDLYEVVSDTMYASEALERKGSEIVKESVSLLSSINR